MKIPTKLRYGIRFMCNIAAYYESNSLVSVSQISREENISRNYLEQIVSMLTSAGYIESTRGKHGGYKIVVDPCLISAYDIAFALKEDFVFLDCVRNTDSCARNSECKTYPMWREMSSEIIKKMKSIMLCNLLDTNDSSF